MELNTVIAGIKMKNPVMVASGSFGYGEEPSKFIDLNQLGAIITKTVTLDPREGNPPPRICETSAGMLNSIGLQNKGIQDFIDHVLPFLAKFDTPVIANIAGDSPGQYVQLAKILSQHLLIKGLELNISCPNVKKGGLQFGSDKNATFALVKAVRKATRLPLLVKLSPNVTDIIMIAKAAEEAGADAISLINTILGMAIDIENKQFCLGTKTGGLSGPAIKPVAVRMVWQAAQAVKIPIVGIGGIMNGNDAVEFFLAGASAIEVGTANFIDSRAPIKIIAEIQEYLKRHNLSHYKALIGQAHS